VAIDETSSRRGHNYLTIAADTEERKVVFVTAGKDAKLAGGDLVPAGVDHFAGAGSGRAEARSRGFGLNDRFFFNRCEEG
jgi:hypothetical protein